MLTFVHIKHVNGSKVDKFIEISYLVRRGTFGGGMSSWCKGGKGFRQQGEFPCPSTQQGNPGKVKIMLYIKQPFYIQSSCSFHNHLYHHSIHEQYFIYFIIFICFFLNKVFSSSLFGGNLMTSCISFLHIDSRCISKPKFRCADYKNYKKQNYQQLLTYVLVLFVVTSFNMILKQYVTKTINS